MRLEIELVEELRGLLANDLDGRKVMRWMRF
jgi:hypothetical protein